MQFWSLDFIIIVVYLLGILYMGIRVGRNVGNLKEFCVSKKNFSTPTIIATIFATGIGGGSTLGVAEQAFMKGWYFLLPIAGSCLGDLFSALIIFRSKLFDKNKAISVGELIGNLYDNNARVVTGILAALVSLGYVSAQISGFGYIFHYFFHIPYIWGMTLGYVVVISYTSFGGMRSVVFTDVVQFGVMIIAIPLLFNVGASQVGGLSNLLDLSLYGNKLCSPEKINFIEIGVLFFVYSLMGLAPSFVQRLLIVKDTKQAFRSVFISALIYFPFLTLVIGIGIIAFNLKPDLDANFALPYLIDSLLPIGLKGLLIVGILSAIMSTADSDLNIIGISLVNDVILPFRKSKLIDKQEIVLARAITFTFGIISIFIPLYFKSILDIVVFVVNFWAPTMFVPLAMAILGRKVSPKAFFTCLCLGLSSTLMYHYFAQNKYEAGPIVGILTNLLTFCTCYKFEQKRLRF